MTLQFRCAPAGRRGVSDPRTAALLLFLTVLFPSPARAQHFALRSSPHDFSTVGEPSYRASYGNLCVSCHAAPSGSTVAPAPQRAVWQSEDTGSFQMYRSPTMDMAVRGTPSPVSLACLSCHDGTVASSVHSDPNDVLGTDLRNDHPISIEYDPRLDRAFRDAAEVRAAGLKLYAEGGVQMVECATCHNPHDNETAPPFLRMSNENSRLCLTCHLK